MENIDNMISLLGYTLLSDSKETFEEIAELKAKDLTENDIEHLKNKLHNPPEVYSEIDKKQLQLGQWLSVCQYVIFELFYNLHPHSIQIISAFAFGEYDWTQATALEVLCRWYVKGKVSVDTISEINTQMGNMRDETHYYLAKSLLIRQKRDVQFEKVINELNNELFREILKELSE